MLIVSASLKKSGTGWLFNMLNDLLVAAGHEDSRALRDRHGLGDVVRGANCHGHPRWQLVRRVLPVIRRETLAMSTHAGPNPELLALMALGLAKATYLYRDPRDAALSVLDHAARGRQASPTWKDEVAGLESVEDAARYIGERLRIYRRWSRVPGVLMLRYEDLTADAPGQLRRLARHLGLDVPEAALREVAARYDKRKVAERAEGEQWGAGWSRLHFNMGVAGRYAEEMSAAERAVCAAHFGPYLERMGYAS